MKELSLIEKVFFLKKVSLFEDLDLDTLLAIADKINQDIYDKNEKIFEVNQKPSRIYFIAKGEVILSDKNNEKIKILLSESFFGEESLFNERPREYNATCFKDAIILTFTKLNLLRVISESPSVAISLLEIYAKTTYCRHKNKL